MSWLLLIKTLIEGLAGLVKFLADRQLIQVGEAKQIAENLTKESERVKAALTTADNVSNDPDSVLNDKSNRFNGD